MVEMAVDDRSAAPKLNTELYSLHSQGAEAVSVFLFLRYSCALMFY